MNSETRTPESLPPGRYYESSHKRLVCIKERADEAFWDATWDKQPRTELYPQRNLHSHLFTATTRKYLAPGSRLIEGGCGLAWLAWRLHLLGYHVEALDYAPRTIDFLKEQVPEVNPILGDVMALPFEAQSFDGYWSIGVIEHFWTGYQSILSEAARVLKPGGYLFLTFPHMSWLRRFKARKGAYLRWQSEIAGANFYQFLLDEYQVIKDADQFELVERRPFDGIGGLRSELRLGRSLSAKASKKNSLPAKVIKRLLAPFLDPWASHSVLLVLRRR